jgi:hypothetical protein
LSPDVDSDSDFDQQAGKQPTNNYQDSEEEEGVAEDDDDEYEPTENTEDSLGDGEVEEYDSEKEHESQIDPNDISLPSTPHYPSTNNESKRMMNSSKVSDAVRSKSPQLEKNAEEQDSDSFDPVDEDNSTSYDKLGDIVPTIRRFVLRGQGKNYYGVGRKPFTITEAKARGKTNTKFPQPGDIGELNIQLIHGV